MTSKRHNIKQNNKFIKRETLTHEGYFGRDQSTVIVTHFILLVPKKERYLSTIVSHLPIHIPGDDGVITTISSTLAEQDLGHRSSSNHYLLVTHVHVHTPAGQIRLLTYNTPRFR